MLPPSHRTSYLLHSPSFPSPKTKGWIQREVTEQTHPSVTRNIYNLSYFLAMPEVSGGTNSPGGVASIHRESENCNSRKPTYRILQPYALGPGQGLFLRSPPVLWSMHFATRMYGYSADSLSPPPGPIGLAPRGYSLKRITIWPVGTEVRSSFRECIMPETYFPRTPSF